MFATLRILHIVCGTFWTGSALLIAGFVQPTVRGLGPEGGRFMERFSVKSGFPIAMTGAGFITLVTGFYLLWAGSGGFAAGWPANTFDLLIALGGLAGIIAFVLGIGVNAPTAARLGRLAGEVAARGGPPSAEQQQQIATLQRRLHQGGRTSAGLLLLATALMAAARVA
jgi:hypothetical protein